ncbi:MAG: lamin tail domain-containing protein [Bacteroidales bacterium]|nr:lamin tail domain-containing protein [Bacteroidales bacterium]
MKSLLYIFLFFPFLGFTQVWDDFSDGNFTQDPSWSGDASQFKVNDDLQLQLDSEGTEISHLGVSFALQQQTEWRFWIKCPFSASANNNARFYLASSQLNLEGPLTGYFIQFGEAGSNDAIELFRQDGDAIVSVCRGSEGFISDAFELTVRIRKDTAGNWIIETDLSGGGAYQLEASGFDNSITTSASLGVFCQYTSSNSTKFYFDEIYAGSFVIDNIPPELLSLVVKNESSIDLLFDEAIEEESAENKQNYFVSNQIESPIVAQLDAGNAALVHLTFDRAFPNGEMLTLSIQNIKDLAGNVAPAIEKSFVLYIPPAYAVQINEIMADPSPGVGLPEWEYIELFNTTELPIDLTGWTLKIGNTEKVFENITINPAAYLILADEDAGGEFIFSEPFYGFSSFALTNAGQSLVLKNTQGAIISSVSYTDAWYRDPNKDEGGWSLEQIDPLNPCGGPNNWSASVNQSGGTPGAENSINASNPDYTQPYAQRVEITDSATLILHFSESMDSVLLFNVSAYEINRDIGNPELAVPKGPAYESVELLFSEGFEKSLVYTLTVTNENFIDCSGNPIDNSIIVSFGLPDEIAENDIVINEVLFNPKDDLLTGVDFVEIYNRSQKILDLKNLLLATEDEDSGELISPKELSTEGYLFFPEEYLVLSVNPEVVKAQYFTENPNGFIKMESMPSFNNDEGTVVLVTKGFLPVDRMKYSESMQYPLLTTFDGVSLERIHFDRPSGDVSNWHSAAEDVGFATPSYRNSQFGEIIETIDPITIDPEIFSPDSDGKDDMLNIYYKFDSGGKNCTINIYDSRGRQVRSLVNNEFLGTSGQFSWDGLNNDGQKAAIGIYVIFVEIFDTEGHREHYKKTAVLGTRF